MSAAASPQAWERLGLLFRSEGQRRWMQSHVQMAHAEPVEGSVVRIYFTCRDEANRSHVAFLLMDLEAPGRVLDLSDEPLLAPGPRGAYDARGIMSSWLTVEGGERRFHLIGWTVEADVPMQLSIGLAGGPSTGEPVIARRLAGPVLARNPHNPFYVSCPCVRRDGAAWRMWYLSGLPWGETAEGRPASRYTVWHARSDDGMHWRPDPSPCLTLAPDEMAIARPCVLKDGEVWRMWYCRRGEGFAYRIGYAESADGETWIRQDGRIGFSPPQTGFDADMACYPYVFDHGGSRWMLYSGDGFGAAGLGLARLREGQAA